MPWVPGYQQFLENVREAHSDAVRAALVANLASLNVSLSLGGIDPVLPGPPQISASSITLGDLDRMPDVSAGAFWCQIVAGGERDARDVEAEVQADPAVFKYTLSTNVDFYVHPDAFSLTTDPFLQAQYRERLRLRLTDWMLFAVFNNTATLSLTLASQCFTNAPSDATQYTRLSEIAAGYVDRSFGGSVRVYHLHCCVRSEIFGSVG